MLDARSEEQPVIHGVRVLLTGGSGSGTKYSIVVDRVKPIRCQPANIFRTIFFLIVIQNEHSSNKTYLALYCVYTRYIRMSSGK